MNQLNSEAISSAELAFRQSISDCSDDSARISFAAWLEENGRPSARLRWWISARSALRSAVVWNRSGEFVEVEKAIRSIGIAWTKRLYAVEISRIVRERFPLPPEWQESQAGRVADGALCASELHALGLASVSELRAARKSARIAAGTAAKISFDSPGRYAADAAFWCASSVRNSDGRDLAVEAAVRAAKGAAWGAVEDRSRADAGEAFSAKAWKAAYSAARSAAIALAGIPRPRGVG